MDGSDSAYVLGNGGPQPRIAVVLCRDCRTAHELSCRRCCGATAFCGEISMDEAGKLYLARLKCSFS